jgi:natural product biosynthesis luciferase-like monooxygenase protein
LVDNLSKGRVGLSFATGWHAHDYVIRPENYANRRPLMFEQIPLVKRLWAGDEVEIPGVDGEPTAVRTLPRPIQSELPVWITASSPHTWKDAGRIGVNVLSSMIGNSLEDVEQLVRTYREARVDHGHDPRTGTVSLMLHTFLGEDLEATRDLVREPMKRYLRQFVDQLRPLLDSEYLEEDSTGFDDLLEHAFSRYFQTSSLLGTPDKCAALVQDLAAVGVDEAACLVDFGPGVEETLGSLELLADLVTEHGRPTGGVEEPRKDHT